MSWTTSICRWNKYVMFNKHNCTTFWGHYYQLRTWVFCKQCNIHEFSLCQGHWGWASLTISVFTGFRRKTCSWRFWKILPWSRARFSIGLSVIGASTFTAYNGSFLTFYHEFFPQIFSNVFINASSFFWICSLGTQYTVVIFRFVPWHYKSEINIYMN